MTAKQINISDLLKMFLAHIRLIIILTLVGALVSYLYVSFMVTPVYSTSALILVQTKANFDMSTSSNLGSDAVNVSDISSSVTLANTCSVLFTQDPDMKSIIGGANVSISAVEDSYFLRISASSPDPNTAANIANRVAQAAPTVFQKYFEDAGKVDTVDEASIPSSPSSPDKSQYVMIGLLSGLVIALVISFLLEMVDTTIKPGDDLFKQYDVPVFAEIVDFDVEGSSKKK